MNNRASRLGSTGRLAQRNLLGVAALFYSVVGLALLFIPGWFFDHIGPFPPYNRHYEGDLGSFLLPMGSV